MKSKIDTIYRLYVLIRRLPYIFDKLSFVPLTFDHHVVWDIHEKFLQYRTSLPFSKKILHVINRRSPNFVSKHYPYISELENIFSLLPREILKLKDYKKIKEALKKELSLKELKGLIFQSPGALSFNREWLLPQNKYEVITICPAEIEPCVSVDFFVDNNKVKFLLFASRYHEKGLHIFLDVAKRLQSVKPNYEFSLVTNNPIDYTLSENIKNIVMAAPDLKQRRELYTGHDYVLNLSLGDSLGVFLDSIRFGTPMIGYPGQHGSTYCQKGSSIMLPSPIFVYGKDFLEKYNPFEFEDYLQKLEASGFFKEAKDVLFKELLKVGDKSEYKKMKGNFDIFRQNFSSDVWFKKMKNFYKQF